MSDKIRESGENERGKVYVFHCPGCGYGHMYEVPRWSWNGSLDKPTFTPSLLVNKDYPESRCHLHMTDGMIQFLHDCHHELRDKTVPVPDWDDD